MISSEFTYQIEKEHWWFQARREISRHLFFQNLPLQREVSILSVGASSGVELNFLSQYGNVWGIDINEKAVNQCINHGFRVVKSDITSCKFDDNVFDVVVAMDILEHIPDHQKAYAEILRILKPGGKFLITVPAGPFLWSVYDEFGDYPHVRRYTLSSFRKLLEVDNVTMLKVSYFNFFFFPVLWIVRKIQLSVERQLIIPHPCINKLCKTIFSAEKYWLRYFNFPLGTSLIAIGRKEVK